MSTTLKEFSAGRPVSTEADIGAAIKEFYQSQGHKVYSEVKYGGGRIDAVLEKDGVYTAVECKLGFNVTVFGQAHRSAAYVHRTAIVVGRITGNTFTTAGTICEKFGYGLISVTPDKIQQLVSPIHRPDAGHESLVLHQCYEENIPGTKGKISTPWTHFLRDVEDYVRLHPGCTIREIIGAGVGSYYTKDRSHASKRGLIYLIVRNRHIQVKASHQKHSRELVLHYVEQAQ